MPAPVYKSVWKNVNPGKISALGGEGPGDPQAGGVNPPNKDTINHRKKSRAAVKRSPGSLYVERQGVLDHLEATMEPLWLKDAAKVAFLGDTAYYCPPLNEARAIVHRAAMNPNDYATDIFDCDDYAFALKGYFCHKAFENGRNRPCAYAAGIVWFEEPFPHAMNWIIERKDFSDTKGTLLFIEPQIGKFFSLDKEGVMHEFDMQKGPAAAKPANTGRYGGIYFVTL